MGQGFHNHRYANGAALALVSGARASELVSAHNVQYGTAAEVFSKKPQCDFEPRKVFAARMLQTNRRSARCCLPTLYVARSVPQSTDLGRGERAGGAAVYFCRGGRRFSPAVTNVPMSLP